MEYFIHNTTTQLDMEATGAMIGKLIDESGLNDKQLGEIMHLSVQAINKWRHGYSIPDIGNLYVLSRILGKRVDDFLVSFEPVYTLVEVIDMKEARVAKERRIRKFMEHLIA